MSLAAANTETTAPAAAMDTPKLAVNCGRIGAINPYPSAMRNAAPTSTQMVRGMAGRGGVCGCC